MEEQDAGDSDTQALMQNQVERLTNSNKLIDALFDRDFKTALHILKNNTCDINAQDTFGNNATPLFLCVYFGLYTFSSGNELWLELIREILKHPECDVNIINEHGETALHSACTLNRYYEISLLLLGDTRCDLTIQDHWGYTALHQLLRDPLRTLDHILPILSKMQTNKTFLRCVGLRTSQGFSALDVFLLNTRYNRFEFKTSEATQKLFDLFDVLSTDAMLTNSTAAIAGSFCSREIFELIFLNCAAIDLSGVLPNKETTLHCVLERNSSHRVMLVMKNKPDLSVKWMGQNPIELALSYGCKPDILDRLLREKSCDVKILIKNCSVVGETEQECLYRLKLGHDVSDVTGMQKDSATLSWKEFKRLCSTKIDPGDDKMSTTMTETVSPLSVVKNYRTYFDTNEREIQSMTDSILKLFRRLSEMVAMSESSHFEFNPHLAGSMSDNCRSYFPDEFDVLCIFQNINGLKVRKTDKYYLQLIPVNKTTNWSKYCYNPGFVCSPNVAQAFYNLLHCLLAELVDKKEHFGYLHLFSHSLQNMDKISRLQLQWKGPIFNGMTVHVDVAPAFMCPPEDVSGLPLEVACNTMYALAKSSRHDHFPETKFFISLCQVEKEIISSLSSNAREGYRLAKALRIAVVCVPISDIVGLKLCEVIDITDYLTSYCLKNSLFCYLKAHKQDENAGTQQQMNKCEWADNIYGKLETFLTEKQIPSWTEFNRPLLDCTLCGPGDNYACCMKRNLMLTLTVNIRNWLRKNWKQLEAI